MTAVVGVWHAAEVADTGNGTYAVSFKPEKAGSFQLVLSIQGAPKPSAQKRTYIGICVAGLTAAEKCGLSGRVTRLVAGQPGKLALTRADRCGGNLSCVSMASSDDGCTLACFGNGNKAVRGCSTVIRALVLL